MPNDTYIQHKLFLQLFCAVFTFRVFELLQVLCFNAVSLFVHCASKANKIYLARAGLSFQAQDYTLNDTTRLDCIRLFSDSHLLYRLYHTTECGTSERSSRRFFFIGLVLRTITSAQAAKFVKVADMGYQESCASANRHVQILSLDAL